MRNSVHRIDLHISHKLSNPYQHLIPIFLSNPLPLGQELFAYPKAYNPNISKNSVFVLQFGNVIKLEIFFNAKFEFLNCPEPLFLIQSYERNQSYKYQVK